MKFKIIFSSAILVIFLLGGCAGNRVKFNVNIDSISGGIGNGKSYILLPGNKDTKIDDLQFKEYSAYVNRALVEQGFFPAKLPEDANVAIFLAYGIGDPKAHKYSYAMPVWGKTGVSSSSTISSSNTTGSLSTLGNYGTYSGNTTTNSTTIYTPTYGVKGYTTQVGTRVTYFRFMTLDAIDLNEYRHSQKETQLWKTSVTSTGSSGDLRQVFPVLVAASKPYMSKNTGKIVKVKISENDKRVIAVKGLVKSK